VFQKIISKYIIMNDNYDILFSVMLGCIIVFLFWLTLNPKYIIIKNHNK